MTPVFSVRWIGKAQNGKLEMLDQTKLPQEEKILHLDQSADVREAIVSLRVRGAPAIGAAGAYGLVLAAREINQVSNWSENLAKKAEWLNKARPTAVNLSWALGRLLRRNNGCSAEKSISYRLDALLDEANAIVAEDRAMCSAMGRHGVHLIKPGMGVLTHCNTGILATAGDGTALAVMYEAHRCGIPFKAYADETRPLLQGARLTAWELARGGIDVTLLCDGMAGMLMKQGRVHLVVVGADRIAANGDTANKIGTYSVAVLAKHHGIPFYVVAPSSSFDLGLKNGEGIPIEERKSEEVTQGFGRQTAPETVSVYNPAFDVTPAELITGIVTEKGIIYPPFASGISNQLASAWQPGL